MTTINPFEAKQAVAAAINAAGYLSSDDDIYQRLKAAYKYLELYEEINKCLKDIAEVTEVNQWRHVEAIKSANNMYNRIQRGI